MTPLETKLVEAAIGVVYAILDAGPHPNVHDRIEATSRRQWPYLWKRLDELVLAEEEMQQ